MAKHTAKEVESLIQLFTRRKFLGLIAGAYVVMLPGCVREKQKALGNTASSTVSLCVVRPEQTEGPFFIDQQFNRSDIQVEPSIGIVKQGVPLASLIKLTKAMLLPSILPWICLMRGRENQTICRGFRAHRAAHYL